MKPNKISLILLVVFVSAMVINANNLQIASVERVGTNRDQVKFTISWENSWDVTGAPSNHDAAWVFIKYRECGVTGQQFNHALLSTTMSDHVFGANVLPAKPILATNRLGTGTGHNTGVLIKRNNAALGNTKGHVPATTCTLKVVGATSGINLDPAKEYDIKVFGIEMVQVPEGPFYLGDMGNDVEYTYRQQTAALPVYITAAGSVSLRKDGVDLTTAANFPNGFSEFYCMKYETTQQQYIDFVNTLPSSINGFRVNNINGTTAPTPPVLNGMYYNTTTGQYATVEPNRAIPDACASVLSFSDMLAYLDWACLRPMTDFEYEKACRGPLAPVNNEYAWGTATPIRVTGINYPASGQEMITIPNNNTANVALGNGNGCSTAPIIAYTGLVTASRQPIPVEVGLFARDGNPFENRITTGATYYGIMEMTGNAMEVVVRACATASFSVPNTYNGTWGDGVLTGTGNADTPGWLTNYAFKGGSYDSLRPHVNSRVSSNPGENSNALNVTTLNDQMDHPIARGVR